MKRIAMRSNQIFREGFDAEERGNDSFFLELEGNDSGKGRWGAKYAV